MTLENRPCRIFFCYRKNTAQIANFVSAVMMRDTEHDYGNIWYSNRVKEGNYDEDPEFLLHEAEIVVFFVGEQFTGGFLDDCHKTVESTVTARELVAMEKERRRREEAHEEELRILVINLDGNYLDEQCYHDLRILFLNEGLMNPAPKKYTSRNAISFDTRSQDIFDLVKNDLGPRCAKPPKGRPVRLANGNYLFGTYSQLTEDCTDDTPIEWIVLSKDDNSALLLSRYALDSQPFNRQLNNEWQESYIKKWLNGWFRKLAFSGGAEEYILPSSDNTSGGRIFLLSQEEATVYLPIAEKRRCAPTEYSGKPGNVLTNYRTQVDGKAACPWWLRSQGSANCAVFVDTNGAIIHEGETVYNIGMGIRPALRVKLVD